MGIALSNENRMDRIIQLLAGFPWVKITSVVEGVGRKYLGRIFPQGTYELLDYTSTLTLHDKQGKRATFAKRLTVRYLQNEIIAHQDYAWGDGKILLNYRTNRGKPVDQYKSGYKTYILISLREVMNRGDSADLRISWDIKDGFLKNDGFWATEVSHRMRKMTVNVIFPKSRPPTRLLLEKNKRRQSRVLGIDAQKRLADGRVQATWQTNYPRLHQMYILRWDW